MPSSPCMKLAIAVFLEWCEKEKKKAVSPLMTKNECKGKAGTEQAQIMLL